MDKKTFSIGIIIIIAIIAIGGAFALGLFDQSPTTNFNTKFMSGSFQGDVVQNNNTSNNTYADWGASFDDKNASIQYNMSSVKNGTFLIDLLTIQGLSSPETREYNGNSWNIYYSQAVPTTTANSTNSTNTTNNSTDNSSVMNVYICEAQKGDQTYLIYVVANSTKVQCDGSLYCDLFTDYIKPMLESTELKENSDAPHLYQTMNVTEQEFNDASKYLEQIKSGNITNSTTSNSSQ